MDQYAPALLGKKWIGHLPSLLEETVALWEHGRPRKRWFLFRSPEPDASHDRETPFASKRALLFEGRVVWGLFTRAFFPAYVPGRRTHYGSVIYALDEHEPDSIFELAWRVNLLRAPTASHSPAVEPIARAIRDDHSDFARVRLPEELGAYGEAYLANVCLHRTRLPTGYLHERLVPLLIAPERTPWCCLLPLRFWPPRLQQLWSSGEPAYAPEQFTELFAQWRITP